MARPARLAASAALAAAVVTGVGRVPEPPIAGWTRLNYRGRPVSLSGGLAASLGALSGALAGSLVRVSRASGGSARHGSRSAGRLSTMNTASERTRRGPLLLAGLAALAAGAYDDLVAPGREVPTDKGFAGHLAALRGGRISGGAVKLALIGTSALVCSSRITPTRDHPTRNQATRVAEVVLGAGVIAGAANLVNLLDLRPGRSLKLLIITSVVGLVGAGDTTIAGALLGASAAALPADLSERVMLGDLGANPLGALLGVRLISGSVRTTIAAATVIGALTLLSERVSFSRVIEQTPALRWADELGRAVEPGRADELGRAVEPAAAPGTAVADGTVPGAAAAVGGSAAAGRSATRG